MEVTLQLTLLGYLISLLEAWSSDLCTGGGPVVWDHTETGNPMLPPTSACHSCSSRPAVPVVGSRPVSPDWESLVASPAVSPVSGTCWWAELRFCCGNSLTTRGQLLYFECLPPGGQWSFGHLGFYIDSKLPYSLLNSISCTSSQYKDLIIRSSLTFDENGKTCL